MSSTARQQARRENALKRLIAHIPPEQLPEWGRKEIMDELHAQNPSLFSSITGSAEERFLRVQKVLPQLLAKPTANPIVVKPVARHEPYVEELDKAAQQLRERAMRFITGKTRFALLKKSDLNICPSYQRDSIDNAKVGKIVSEMDMRGFGVLIVSFRDGKYWVVDGQHRWMAATQRDDMNELPCMVWDSSDVHEEARVFTMLNLNRTTVTPQDKYRALVASEEPVAVRLHESLEIMGVTVSRTGQGANQLAAIAFVYGMARRNFDNCETVMVTVQEVCDEQPLHGDLIKALDYLHTRIEGGVQQPLMVAQLKRIGAHKLMDIIKKAKSTRNGARAQMGLLVLAAINQKLTANKRFMLKEL